MSRSDLVYATILGVISGVMVGVVAALAHRALMWGFPIGLVGVPLMVIAFVTFNRTMGGRLGLAAGIVTLIATLGVFYMATPDSIIVPDAFGMVLGGTVTLTAVLGLAWPESPASHRSRFDDEPSPQA